MEMFYRSGYNRVVYETDSIVRINALCLYIIPGIEEVEYMSNRKVSFTLNIDMLDQKLMEKLFQTDSLSKMRRLCKSFEERPVTRSADSPGLRDRMKYAYSLTYNIFPSYEYQYLLMDMFYRLGRIPSDIDILNMITLCVEILGLVESSSDIKTMYRRSGITTSHSIDRKTLKDIDLHETKQEMIKHFAGIVYPSHCFPRSSKEKTISFYSEKIFAQGLNKYPLIKQAKIIPAKSTRKWQIE